MTETEQRDVVCAALARMPPEAFGYVALALRALFAQLVPEDGGFTDESRHAMTTVQAEVETYLTVGKDSR